MKLNDQTLTAPNHSEPYRLGALQCVVNERFGRLDRQRIIIDGDDEVA